MNEPHEDAPFDAWLSSQGIATPPPATTVVPSLPTDDTSLLDAALAYAERGWPVFPLKPRSKSPLTEHGFKDGTTDVNQIAEWWARTPHANIGIATGDGSCVLDPDGPEGEATLAALIAKHGDLPPTLEAQTGKGRHLWFAEKQGLRNTAGRLGPKLDTRGRGGYVVVPPSVHPSGALYRWKSDAPIADMPAWLEALAKPAKAVSPPAAPRSSTSTSSTKRYGAAALADACAKIRGAADGTRNDTLNREAHAIAQLVAGDELDDSTARGELATAARAAGLTDGETKKTLASAFDAGAKNPRTRPEPSSSSASGNDKPRTQATAVVGPALLYGPALAAPLPPLDYLVREIGLIADGGAPHMVAGYGFAGKTLAAQSLALSLAAGAPVWGAYRSRAPRRVLHVDLEQGDRLTRRRYQRLALADAIDLAAVGDALAVAVMPAISLSREHTERWRELMTGRDLVIVDSLRAATAGADENDSAIRGGLDMLGNLSESTGCRALVIHHSRKPSADDPGGRYAIRGSSAIYDACDSVYVFAASKGEPILVEHVKARSHGEPCEDIALVISDVEQNGDPRCGVRVTVRGAELVAQRREEREHAAKRARSTADADTVRRLLRDRPGLGSRELRAGAGMSVVRLDAALSAIGSELEIRDEIRGRSRVARHYLKGAT